MTEIKITNKGGSFDIELGGLVAPTSTEAYALFAIALAERGVDSLFEVAAAWERAEDVLQKAASARNLDRIRTAKRWADEQSREAAIDKMMTIAALAFEERENATNDED